MRTTAVFIRLFARATRAVLVNTIDSEGGQRRPQRRRVSSGHLDRGSLMHELDEAAQYRRISVRQHTVPQVEDVPGPPCNRGQNSLRRALHPLPWPEQQRRVEVSLDALLRPDDLPA